MKNLGIRLFSFCFLILFLAGTVAAAGVLVPIGRAVGLEVETEGLTVAGFQEIADNPARRAGLQTGDVIMRVDGQKVPDADRLRDLVDRAKTALVVTVYRENREENLSVQPRETDSGKQLGVYVRKGITGIGTVTYYDPETGHFGALGHGVSSPGGGLFPMDRGTILEAQVNAVKKGRSGTPGQLQGSFSQPIGALDENSVCGVFGRMHDPWPGTPLPVAARTEIQKGPARILSNVSGTEVQAYNVEILRLYPQDDTRNLLLKVTDPALLTQTGGIVCGMSGSPILQNGKLIGAVTHVLVNDPTQGYGIFIENMLDAAA